MNTMDTLSSSTINSIASGSKGYELLITAHPLYSQNESKDDTSIDSYNVAVELGLNGICVNLVKETSEGKRTVVTSIKSEDGTIPYTHSFGLSKNYAMIVLQPLRLNSAPDKQIEFGFLRSMDHVDHTRVILLELETGKVVLDKSVDEKVYFYHMISQAEIMEDDDTVVSLRLCAYQNPDQLTKFLRSWAEKKNYQLPEDIQALVHHKKVIKRINKEVQKANKHFGQWEKIKAFELTPEAWTIENGLLTPTMKMKRDAIKSKFIELYDRIYS